MYTNFILEYVPKYEIRSHYVYVYVFLYRYKNTVLLVIRTAIRMPGPRQPLIGLNPFDFDSEIDWNELVKQVNNNNDKENGIVVYCKQDMTYVSYRFSRDEVNNVDDIVVVTAVINSLVKVLGRLLNNANTSFEEFGYAGFIHLRWCHKFLTKTLYDLEPEHDRYQLYMLVYTRIEKMLNKYAV